VADFLDRGTGELPKGDTDEDIVKRAHLRFMRCQSWESVARNYWLDDYKFANGDAYNNFQWPDAIYNSRGSRPSLTVNQTRQHNLHIINDAKQHKTAVHYRATGDGASEQSAQIYEGIYRHIQNVSNGQAAHGKAIEFQVTAGLGFTRIVSDYVGADTFDQEIYIRSVPDPLCVYLDCDSREIDGSDARYGFIFCDRPRDEVEEKYPDLTERLGVANAVDGQDGGGWIRQNHVREAEYYEITEHADKLLGDLDGTTILASEATPDLIKKWEEEAKAKGGYLRKRDVVRREVKWYLIVGTEIADRTDVPGTTVPIIPWVGEVTIIDGQLDRKGHTRALISAQQMMNYNWSASVEFGSLQSKSPWIAPSASIEGYETYWNVANEENFSVLPWNHRDDQGQEIPAPVRSTPAQSAPVYIDGIQVANQFMQAASGQYQAELGAPGNEKSGKAINERQRQADQATYHFVDNQALAIRREGQIILEWVPSIYDTKRVVRIIGEDDSEAHVEVDPNAEQAIQDRVFNPNVGKYEVVSDVGPDYATQRQEAFDAIVQILTQAPQLIGQVGDLLFKVADFPLADQIAERLKPGLTPEAQAAVGNLQEQLQNKNRLLAEAMQALTEERLKVKSKDQETEINAFKADTDRTKMLLDTAAKVDPAAAMEMIREMAQQAVHQALQDNLGPVRLSTEPTLALQAQGQPLPGATGAVPHQPLVPNPGLQAATPGGA
jgi:hypothetical protein